MGQKANPIGNRLGIIRGWDSNWFGGKAFGQKVVEDEKIRTYLNARIAKGGIARIIIERTLKRITVSIQTSRPGIIIGKGGTEVDSIREELKKLTNQDISVFVKDLRDAFFLIGGRNIHDAEACLLGVPDSRQVIGYRICNY